MATRRDSGRRSRGSGAGLFVEVPVLGDEGTPLGGDVEFVVDRIYGTYGNAVRAVDADGGVDEILVFRIQGMYAINRADLQTGGVFNPDTWFGYYVGHTILLAEIL